MTDDKAQRISDEAEAFERLSEEEQQAWIDQIRRQREPLQHTPSPIAEKIRESADTIRPISEEVANQMLVVAAQMDNLIDWFAGFQDGNNRLHEFSRKQEELVARYKERTSPEELARVINELLMGYKPGTTEFSPDIQGYWNADSDEIDMEALAQGLHDRINNEEIA